MTLFDKEFIDRFNSKISLPDENGCMMFVGAKRHYGYGAISHKGKALSAHRVAYQIANGSIPDGMFICHRCDNPGCCTLSHLFMGTPKENTWDMMNKKRGLFKKGINTREHYKITGRDHPRQKINDKDKEEIIELIKNNVRCCDIAKIYKVDRHTISAVKSEFNKNNQDIRLFFRKHSNAKLSDSQIIEIREKYKQGIKPKILSELYNTCKRNIHDIAKYRTWKHI